MVDDPEILPILISSLPPPAHLRQPLQIFSFSLPPNGSLLVYCDGCPNHIESRDGGGDIVTMTGSGVVRVYGVKIAFGSPLVTEARVVLVAIPLALEEVTLAIFVSDNHDLIDGLNGRRFIRPAQENLFSELWHAMSRLRERYCLHSFRDGLSLSDAIGREVRAGGYLHSSVPPGHAVEIPEAGLREEHQVLLSRLTRKISAIKIDCFRADEIQKYSLDEVHEKRRWCPEKP